MDFEEQEEYSLMLIKHLRDAENQFYNEYGLEGAYFKVKLEVSEMDASFQHKLRTITDEDLR